MNINRLSIVIPCYNSQNSLDSVVNEIKNKMQDISYNYEIILINDCSTDSTMNVIRKLSEDDERILGGCLAKNCGQHGAVMAGLHYATGDIVICGDDDGQTPFNEMDRLIDGILNGHDVVYARYSEKKHSGFRNLGSYCNDLMARWLLGKPKELILSSYFAAKRFVIEEIKKYNNPYPYLMGLVLRTTDDVVNVDVDHRRREQGKSGYSLGKLLSLWMNGFTSFSIKPLRLSTTVA